MRIEATVASRSGELEVSTEGEAKVLPLPPKESGRGSSVNGGELLFLARATCYCNDVYREAAGAGLRIDEVHVTALQFATTVNVTVSTTQGWRGMCTPSATTAMIRCSPGSTPSKTYDVEASPMWTISPGTVGTG